MRGLPDAVVSGLPEVLVPGGPFLAMELRHAGRGVARPPPGHEGLGYWDSPFLFFGMSVTPDAAVERAASALGERLHALLSPHRTGTNALTFLLPRHEPTAEGERERVRQAYRPAHYARLSSLKARYDPHNLLGDDRNIPPSA